MLWYMCAQHPPHKYINVKKKGNSDLYSPSEEYKDSLPNALSLGLRLFLGFLLWTFKICPVNFAPFHAHCALKVDPHSEQSVRAQSHQASSQAAALGEDSWLVNPS